MIGKDLGPLIFVIVAGVWRLVDLILKEITDIVNVDDGSLVSVTDFVLHRCVWNAFYTVARKKEQNYCSCDSGEGEAMALRLITEKEPAQKEQKLELFESNSENGHVIRWWSASQVQACVAIGKRVNRDFLSGT
ncbi:hypothetical protein NL676_038672 [Syzygium grande]|nr:hypothetical protein NL676_038672 [Syzygium grande]